MYSAKEPISASDPPAETEKPISPPSSARAMAQTEGPFTCETCDATVTIRDARRSKPMGDLDPMTWQTLCCPHCGSRLRTVYVGE